MTLKSTVISESKMTGNKPSILNENDFKIEEIDIYDDNRELYTLSTNPKFEIIEKKECYLLCNVPNSPLTLDEKKGFMISLIFYDISKDDSSKPTHFCVFTKFGESKLVTYKINKNSTYYVEIIRLKDLCHEKELSNLKRLVNS